MERLCLIVFAALTLMCLTSVEASNMDIGRMIQFVDPKVSWLISARKFQNYGCYCNEKFPTEGKTPVDEVDQCCLTHNKCHAKLISDAVCPKGSLGQSYGYDKINKNNAKSITCTSNPRTDTCKYELCKCDAVVAKCFADNEINYNGHNKGRC